MSIAGGLFASSAVLLWSLSPERRWRPGPLLPAAIAWLVATLAAGLFAEDRAASLPRIGKALMPAIVPLVAMIASKHREGLRALGVLLLSSAAASTFGIIFFLVGEGGLQGRARGPS